MSLISVLKLLFCFRKPDVKSLTYINVIVANKPSLFIVWEIENVLYVKLASYKGRHYAKKRAMVISTAGGQQEIIMKATNFWRTTKTVLQIRVVQLDKAIVSELINGFRPLSRKEVIIPFISKINANFEIKQIIVSNQIKPFKIKERFNINIQNFNYP